MYCRIRDKVLANFNRTSIELEKRARILFLTTIIAFFLMFLVIPFAGFHYQASLSTQLNFAVLALAASLLYGLVLFALSRGRYIFASQLFIWNSLMVGLFSAFLRRTGLSDDIYWIWGSTSIVILLSSLISIDYLQLLQAPLVSTSVLIVLQVGFAKGIESSMEIFHLFTVIFLIWLNFLFVLIGHRSNNEALVMLQDESNQNSIRLSKWMYIYAENHDAVVNFEKEIRAYFEECKDIDEKEQKLIEELGQIEAPPEAKKKINQLVRELNVQKIRSFTSSENFIDQNERCLKIFEENMKILK